MIKHYLVSGLLALSFVSCYDNVISSIPDYPVQLQLNLTSTYPTFKNSVNHFIIYDKKIRDIDFIGYGGIIIYTGFNGEYNAYDMACPFEAKQNIRVYPNELGQAVCEGCGSVFQIGDAYGIPKSGPATEVLKRYRTSLSGDYLNIFR